MKNQFGFCLRGYHPILGVGISELTNVQIHLSLGKVVDMSSVCVVQGSKLH